MKTNLIAKINCLIAVTEYIESVNEALNCLFVKACKASDYVDCLVVENAVNEIVEINGLEV